MAALFKHLKTISARVGRWKRYEQILRSLHRSEGLALLLDLCSSHLPPLPKTCPRWQISKINIPIQLQTWPCGSRDPGVAAGLRPIRSAQMVCSTTRPILAYGHRTLCTQHCNCLQHTGAFTDRTLHVYQPSRELMIKLFRQVLHAINVQNLLKSLFRVEKPGPSCRAVLDEFCPAGRLSGSHQPSPNTFQCWIETKGESRGKDERGTVYIIIEMCYTNCTENPPSIQNTSIFAPKTSQEQSQRKCTWNPASRILCTRPGSS